MKKHLKIAQFNEISSYWTKCPKEDIDFPKKICDLGSNKKCDWWINSKKHNNCYWSYLKDLTYEDGSIFEHSISDISKLFNWTNIKTQEYLIEALEEVSVILKQESD